MRVIVCGGRHFRDEGRVRDVLDALHAELGDFVVIEGGAPGADSWAYNWARSRGDIPVTKFADWTYFGKAAGAIRNQQMLDEKPDLVIAFPGSRGTADMVRRAKKAGIPVREVK